MNTIVKCLYVFVGITIVGFYSYSAYYGRALWEDPVQKNTEYKGNRVYGGYGNRFNHK